MIQVSLVDLENYLVMFQPIYQVMEAIDGMRPITFFEYYHKIPDMVMMKVKKNGGLIKDVDTLLEVTEIFLLLFRLQFPEFEKWVYQTHLYFQNHIEPFPECSIIDTYHRSRWKLMYSLTKVTSRTLNHIN